MHEKHNPFLKHNELPSFLSKCSCTIHSSIGMPRMRQREKHSYIRNCPSEWIAFSMPTSCTINIGRKHVNVFQQKKKTRERKKKSGGGEGLVECPSLRIGTHFHKFGVPNSPIYMTYHTHIETFLKKSNLTTVWMIKWC